MTLFVSVVLLLLVASQAQATPRSDIGEELVPDSGEELVPDNGEEELVPDNGEEQLVPDNGEEQLPEEIEDISTSILTSNNNSAEFLLEGDLLPPKTRNAMKCWYNACRWPKGSDGKVTVAFIVSNEFSSYEKYIIGNALREMESQTCIRFVPRSREYNYISVENQGGCYSALGQQGGKQVLSLNRRGCVNTGIVQHEFNHALGFKHEQTRSDRDQYVRINWPNIYQNMAYNFYKSDTNNLNTPYDYNSIMHYGRTAFSMNGRETITPLHPTGARIGQRQTLSQWDIRRIKLLYNC